LEALLRLLRGEALAAASQVLEHLLQGDVLLQQHKKQHGLEEQSSKCRN
jgi:hypothetical protein